jgi:c-di-AMP phosphodiesterase-like protein
MPRKNDPIGPIFAFIFVILIIIAIFIVMWIIVLSGIIIIGAIIGVYYFLKFQKEKQEKEEKNKLSAERRGLWEQEQFKLTAEREKFEAEQKEKGLIKFLDRDNNEKWGTPEEIEKWKKDDEESKIKDLLINRIVQSIQKFQPARKWPDEDSYHKELLGYLKVEYPDIKYEFQTGSSRPDLVIGNIAIEIKGPTDNNALDT